MNLRISSLYFPFHSAHLLLQLGVGAAWAAVEVDVDEELVRLPHAIDTLECWYRCACHSWAPGCHSPGQRKPTEINHHKHVKPWQTQTKEHSRKSSMLKKERKEMQVIPTLDISKARRGLLYWSALNLPVVAAWTYTILHVMEAGVGELGPAIY